MTNLKSVSDGQNIYDLSLLIYGDVSKAFNLCLDNGTGLDYDLTGVQEIAFTEGDFVVPTYQKSTQYLPQPEKFYTVRSGQNLYDVALQLYADATAVFSIVNYSLDDDVTDYQQVLITDYSSLYAASKLVIDLSGRLIGTKKYQKVTYKYLGTETRIILTTESGLKLIVE